uniref:Uncharacterized protein n=1 Tax=Mus spicilegus TaxID=10103 RepID=A0A8C6N0L2_MUSSI
CTNIMTKKQLGRKGCCEIMSSREKLVARSLLHEKTRSRSRKREEGKIELISCPIPSSSAETLRGLPSPAKDKDTQCPLQTPSQETEGLCNSLEDCLASLRAWLSDLYPSSMAFPRSN